MYNNLWWDVVNDNDRRWQQAETFYVTSTGEVFYTPDGEGRYYYDDLAEALAEVGETRETANIRMLIA